MVTKRKAVPRTRPAAASATANAHAKANAHAHANASAANVRGGADAPLAPLAPPSLTQQAYERIKEMILSLELRPGLFINESSLCELTGIGRMPVHQAIHRLQAEGMIEVIPRKGLVIRMDSLQDIMLLLEARLAFEPNVVALCAERISPAQVAELKALLKKSRGLMNQSQRESFSMIDRTFHRVIAEASGNKFLADSLRPLHERSDMIWHLRIMPADGLAVTQREHEAVLDAIASGNPLAAHRAMEAHLRSLHDRILRASNP
jgi:DNA-binding GntR family transcriptional regulator